MEEGHFLAREIYLDETCGFSDIQGFEEALRIGNEFSVDQIKRGDHPENNALDYYNLGIIQNTIIVCREDLLETLFVKLGKFVATPLDENGKEYIDPESDKKAIRAELREISECWLKRAAAALFKRGAL